MKFGDFWRAKGAQFWNRMAQATGTTDATRVLIKQALQAESVIEVGCGAGHLAQMVRKGGYSGDYWGCDISQVAVLQAAKKAEGKFVAGDFLELSRQAKVPQVQVAISRDAVQHQQHWMPFVMAMLRHAPVAVIAMTRPGYVKPDGLHRITNGKTFYDVQISLSQLRLEAEAAGLHVEVSPSTNPHGREAAVVFRRSQ